METVELTERGAFCVCGYAVETTPEHNDRDVSKLYKDFFQDDKETVLRLLSGSKNGFYGLSWYTHGHERYCYLLGVEVANTNSAPANALIKTIAKTTYAVARFPGGADIIEAWNRFFYTDIPSAGFAPNERHGYYFEYYPGSVYGSYELWVPVVKC